MPEQKMIPCPYCKGTMFTPIDGMDSRLPCIHCDDGTIPDRRAPSAAERAVERIKALIEENWDEVQPQSYELAEAWGVWDRVRDIINEEASRDQ